MVHVKVKVSLLCEPTKGTEKCILLFLGKKGDLESDF